MQPTPLTTDRAKPAQDRDETRVVTDVRSSVLVKGDGAAHRRYHWLYEDLLT